MSLCLFTEHDLREGRVTHEVLLDPRLNRTGDTWHVMLPDLDSTLLYGGWVGWGVRKFGWLLLPVLGIWDGSGVSLAYPHHLLRLAALVAG